MSRSNNTELNNPSTRWFEWAGGDGKVKYYDKEAKENVYVDLPFTFLVLDILSTVTGYSDEQESGIWANEIRNIKTDVLTVRTKHGQLAKGIWEVVKATTGTRYTQSAYIAYKDGKELKLGNIKLSGSAVGPWIEFRKGKNIYEGAITIIGAEARKKGKTNYFEPVFEAKGVSEDTNARAVELDRALQEYLAAYFNKKEEQAIAANANGKDLGFFPPDEKPWNPGEAPDDDDPDSIPF